jgi:hypothetical protein
MNLLAINNKKNTAVFCLILYVGLSFLNNIGASLCFGTQQHRHIGIHFLNYDNCQDEKICQNIISPKTYQNHFDHENFDLNLNSIPSLDIREIINLAIYSTIFCLLIIYKEKYNNVNWDIYGRMPLNKPPLALQTVSLLI